MLALRYDGFKAPIELPDADLRGADLPRADLDEAVLTGGRLDHANLSGASLTYAKLIKASLLEVDLSGADLTGADLRDADLEGAQLDGASLADADLRGVAIAGAVGRPASIAGSKLDFQACSRSELEDEHIIELWQEGAELVDLDRFSARVRQACRAVTTGPSGGVPSLRDLGQLDLEARRQLSDTKRRTTSGEMQALSLERLDFASNPPPASAPPAPSLPKPNDRIRKISGQFSNLFTAEDLGAIELESEPPAASKPPKDHPAAERTTLGERIRTISGQFSNLFTAADLADIHESELPADVSPAADTKPPADSKPPAVVEGGFRILNAVLDSPLGKGNLGQVWTGQRGSEKVAVKFFDRAKLEQGLCVAAFRRGADTLRRLSEDDGCPYVLRVRAVAENRLALVTDLAENGSLEGYPALGWKAAKTVKLFRKICEGIGEAHSRGFLHRALKPSNVLLDGELEPRITDFDMVDYMTLLDTGAHTSGYLPYAAPEEMLGSGTRSPTADVFSLGRILWFMLAGVDPNEPSTQIARAANLHDQPKGLVRIIRKCTMPEPYHRYQLVDDLLDDLDRWESADVGVERMAETPMSLRPAHVSALPKQAPWIPERRSMERPSRASLAKGKAADRSVTATSPGARKIELGLAAFGSLVMLVSLARIWLQAVPTERLVDQAHLAMILAGPLTAFWVPRSAFVRPGIARISLAVVVAGAFFFLEPSPLAGARLRRTVSNGSIAERVAAVQQLIALGQRDLQGADLHSADLSGLDLGAVDLREADLRSARLEGTALMEAQLVGARLSDANISGADLTQAHVSIQELADTICDETTLLPRNMHCEDGQPMEGPSAAPTHRSKADAIVF